MLSKCLLCVVLLSSFRACLSKSNEVTFKNVTFRAYSMYTEKYKRTIQSSRNLKDFLPEIVHDKIEIKEQNVPVLYENSLANMEELDELVIENSNTYEIRPGALKNVPMLRRLSLKGNKLEEIKTGVFNNLELSTLDLSLNFITNIDSSAFDNMPNLLHVNLADNALKKWDKNWFNKTPLLSRVSFQNNSLEELPRAAFKNLAGVKKFGKVDLTVNLVFSHNKINKIHPKTFEGLQNINNLWLDFNLLENFNDDILTGLEVKDLRIDHNKIKCLDGNLKNIFKAEINHIDANPFDCECLEKVKSWTKENKKQVDYFFADMECTAQRIKTKMTALEKRLKEIRGNKVNDEGDDESDVETFSVKNH